MADIPLHLVDSKSTLHTQLRSPPWEGLPWLSSLPESERQTNNFIFKKTDFGVRQTWAWILLVWSFTDHVTLSK